MIYGKIFNVPEYSHTSGLQNIGKEGSNNAFSKAVTKRNSSS